MDPLAQLASRAAFNAQLRQGAPLNVQAPAVVPQAPSVVGVPPVIGNGGPATDAYQGGAVPHLAGARPKPALYSEIDRILTLPACSWMTPEQLEEFNRGHILGNVYESGWRLFNVQAEAIRCYEEYGGLFGIIAVGWGKTLICLMVAAMALRKGIPRVVIHVPANVCGQLWDTDIGWARRRVPLPCQFFNMHGRPAKARRALAKSEKRGVYIFPYSQVSRPDSIDLLRWISPGLLVCDEAHKIGDESAARTRRWKTFVNERQPELVCLSGSFTDKGPGDYHHMIVPALRDNSPLPHSTSLLRDWSAVIGSRTGDARENTGPSKNSAATVMPLLDWARRWFPAYMPRLDATQEGFRLAYRMRLTTAPGVVATGDTEIGVSLVMRNYPAGKPEESPGGEALVKLIEKVEMGETPIGDIIEHAIHRYKWMFELSAGFYNELFWQEPEDYARTKGLDLNTAVLRLDAARDHHAAHQEYMKELRSFFQTRHIIGLDTPMLVGQHHHNHGAIQASSARGVTLFEAWRYMKSLEFEGMPERMSRAIRICPYKVNKAVEWAAKYTQNGAGGIIWVWNEELGLWIYEALVAAGAQHALHCPAGKKYDKAIGNLEDPLSKGMVVIASISAHGEGKNLQFHQNQLFVQWPRSAKKAQQTLGRTHRNGQVAEELEPFRMDTTEFDRMVFGACLVDAVYIQQTTGDRQKIVTCGYSPLPPIFPPEFLRERGFQNRLLDAQQSTLLSERFVAS